MVGRVLGWLLVCDPPTASSQDLETALGVSRASISVATRFLEATRLVKRRTRSGERVHRFELDPRAFIKLADAERYRAFRLVLEECMELRPADVRLQQVHDFYAYMEREITLLIERYDKHIGPEAGSVSS
jgi:DNA-binding transcriptional regulator GbsR (MarR family)